MDLEDLQEMLTDTLPKSGQKHIPVILNFVADMLQVEEVEIHHARVAVETVSVYGLTIALDANGEAVTVEFPRGAVII